MFVSARMSILSAVLIPLVLTSVDALATERLVGDRRNSFRNCVGDFVECVVKLFRGQLRSNRKTICDFASKHTSVYRLLLRPLGGLGILEFWATFQGRY